MTVNPLVNIVNLMPLLVFIVAVCTILGFFSSWVRRQNKDVQDRFDLQRVADQLVIKNSVDSHDRVHNTIDREVKDLKISHDALAATMTDNNKTIISAMEDKTLRIVRLEEQQSSIRETLSRVEHDQKEGLSRIEASLREIRTSVSRPTPTT